jgi:hypothetical protein
MSLRDSDVSLFSSAIRDMRYAVQLKRETNSWPDRGTIRTVQSKK